MAARPSPLQLQVPDYPDETDWDLPTSTDTTFDDTSNQDLFNVLLHIPPFHNDTEWVRESVTANDNVRPLVHNPKNSCYRNAALSALMNLSPFNNFIQKCQSWLCSSLLFLGSFCT